VGETRVDLQHLLEDLRDAYSGPLEETILTEVVANALDSGATRIRLLTNAADATLTVVDDGRAMLRRELARFHDVAASSKRRGEGIGFAGVGIKLGLLISREVVTETRRRATHVATRWRLASRQRAPWKWMPPEGLTDGRGTAVKLVLTNQLSPLLDAGYIEEVVRKHFEPLLDPAFDEILRRKYHAGVTFEVDGRVIAAAESTDAERASLTIRIGRSRATSAVGFLERHPSLSPDRQGIAISTYGKVIKRGWEWLGLTQASPTVGGLIEVPALAACLTLSKNDFIRSGARGASYLGYRKAIQEVVSRQLADWGDSSGGEARPRLARLERDLERVLEDLADDFPLLQSLVNRRTGGQKKLPMPGRGDERTPGPLFAALSQVVEEPAEPGPPPADGEQPPASPAPGSDQRAPNASVDQPAEPPDSAPSSEPAGDETLAGTVASIRARRRPARYGLLVQFESRPGDTELARLVDSTVWINDAHPAYTRAAASRSLGYHTALAVALSLASLAVEPVQEHAFITQFLAQWGSTSSTARRPSRRRRVRKGE
jgi:hypothetical protein